MCEKRGFQVVDELKYAEFQVDGNCPFENIDCNHASGIHFIKPLSAK